MDSHEYLRELMIRAGFAAAKLEFVQKDLSAKGEDVEGVIEFMSGPFFAQSREGYTDEEEGRWRREVRKAVMIEEEDFGGLRMHMWAILARK